MWLVGVHAVQEVITEDKATTLRIKDITDRNADWRETTSDEEEVRVEQNSDSTSEESGNDTSVLRNDKVVRDTSNKLENVLQHFEADGKKRRRGEKEVQTVGKYTVRVEKEKQNAVLVKVLVKEENQAEIDFTHVDLSLTTNNKFDFSGNIYTATANTHLFKIESEDSGNEDD